MGRDGDAGDALVPGEAVFRGPTEGRVRLGQARRPAQWLRLHGALLAPGLRGGGSLLEFPCLC